MTNATPDPRLWILVPAAGTGSRMGGALPKQYLPLAGATVLEHSLQLLLQLPDLARLALALGEGDDQFAQLPLADDPRLLVAPGGAERVDSVRNLLAAIGQQAQAQARDWVLVHDAARPCLAPAELRQFVAALWGDPVGGIMAVPVADTLKRAREQRIVATVDRAQLWQAQTPQMFRYGQLRLALAGALAEGVTVTDEASAMEWAGFEPRILPGYSHNLKITRPADLRLAELILAARAQRAISPGAISPGDKP